MPRHLSRSSCAISPTVVAASSLDIRCASDTASHWKRARSAFEYQILDGAFVFGMRYNLLSDENRTTRRDCDGGIESEEDSRASVIFILVWQCDRWRGFDWELETDL